VRKRRGGEGEHMRGEWRGKGDRERGWAIKRRVRGEWGRVKNGAKWGALGY